MRTRAQVSSFICIIIFRFLQRVAESPQKLNKAGLCMLNAKQRVGGAGKDVVALNHETLLQQLCYAFKSTLCSGKRNKE